MVGSEGLRSIADWVTGKHDMLHLLFPEPHHGELHALMCEAQRKQS